MLENTTLQCDYGLQYYDECFGTLQAEEECQWERAGSSPLIDEIVIDDDDDDDDSTRQTCQQESSEQRKLPDLSSRASTEMQVQELKKNKSLKDPVRMYTPLFMWIIL